MSTSKTGAGQTTASKSGPGKKGTTKAGPRHTPLGEIRIIGGQWKRTKLSVPDQPGLRPTPDRVRETLFNWLGQDLQGWRCVDAFAGTGALGWEAASRGAARVVMLEQNAELIGRLQATQTQLQAGTVAIQRGDALAWLSRQMPASADLVFLDPPFEAPVFEEALRASRKILRAGGWIYLEAPHHWDASALADLGLKEHRYMKAGAVHAHLFQVMENEA